MLKHQIKYLVYMTGKLIVAGVHLLDDKVLNLQQ